MCKRVAEIKVKRIMSTKTETIGALFLNDIFMCFTLEDEYHKTKIKDNTRIPEGKYDIKYRAEGGMFHKYSTKLQNHEKGMLHLQDVEGFTYIYIHVGNYKKQTSGCLLVGKGISIPSVDSNRTMVTSSTEAYSELYYELLKYEEITIEIEEEEKCLKKLIKNDY